MVKIKIPCTIDIPDILQPQPEPRQPCFNVYTPVIVIHPKYLPSAITAIAFLFDVRHTTVTVPVIISKKKPKIPENADATAVDTIDILCKLEEYALTKDVPSSSIECSRVNVVMQPLCPTSYVLFKQLPTPVSAKTHMGRVKAVAIGGSSEQISRMAGSYAITSTGSSTFSVAPVTVQFIENASQLTTLLDTLAGRKRR